MIHLENVTPDNWRIDFQLKKEQENFVSAPDRILARAWAYREEGSQAFIIYDEEEPVGMAMYHDITEWKAYDFSQLFIDCRYQGNGFGIEAARQVLRKMEEEGKYDKVYLCYIDGNEAAKKMYEKLGFEHTGEADEDEIVMVKALGKRNLKQLFESEHINYVEPSEALLQDYLTMVNNIEHVGRFIGRRTEPYTEKQEREFIKGKLEEKAPIFSMMEKQTDEFIGNVELMDIKGSEGELGIAITSEKQDKGFGKEAVNRIVEYGFEVLGLTRIYLKVYPENERAFHVYQKCGFVEYDRTNEDIFMELKKDKK